MELAHRLMQQGIRLNAGRFALGRLYGQLKEKEKVDVKDTLAATGDREKAKADEDVEYKRTEPEAEKLKHLQQALCESAVRSRSHPLVSLVAPWRFAILTPMLGVLQAARQPMAMNGMSDVMKMVLHYVPSHALGVWFSDMVSEQPEIKDTLVNMMIGGAGKGKDWGNSSYWKAMMLVVKIPLYYLMKDLLPSLGDCLIYDTYEWSQQDQWEE